MSSPTTAATAKSANNLFQQLDQLRVRIAGRLHLGLRFEATRYGLRRDLNIPLKRPEAKFPISIRRLEKGDFSALFPVDDSVEEQSDKLEIAWRRKFAANRIEGGYVAVDDRDGTPCYVQWLFGAADNAFIRKLGGFPELAPDEALLENAFTPPRYRGMRIMSAAMASIAEQANDIGARYVLTFVSMDNIASLKGCERAGFAPDLIHSTVRFGFGTMRRDSFVKLDSNDPRRTQKF